MAKIWHQHEIAMALRCLKKYQFAVERNWEPLVHNDNIQVGAAVHEALARYYSAVRDEISPDLVFPPNPDATPQEHLALEIAEHYLQNHPSPVGMKIRTVEEEILVPLSHEDIIAIRPDMTYRQDGLEVVRDYKTLDRLPTADDRAEDVMDIQLNMYLWASWKLYGTVPIFEYVFIRRAVPRDPDKTLEGLVSRAKIISSQERYESALKANNQWPPSAEYRKVLEALPLETGFSSTLRWTKTAEQLAQFEREMISALKLVEFAETEDVFPRTIIKTGGERCSSCPFFTVCNRELNDGQQLSDTEMRLQGFKQKTKEGVHVHKEGSGS